VDGLAALQCLGTLRSSRPERDLPLPDEFVRRVRPGELLHADDHSLRLVDGTVFRAPPGMILPTFPPEAPLRIEYTVIDGQAILRRVPELLRP
jgi:hypothetical protein